MHGAKRRPSLITSHVLPALRKFHAAKTAGKPEVVVWITGTPLREFLYVDDPADAVAFLSAGGQKQASKRALARSIAGLRGPKQAKPQPHEASAGAVAAPATLSIEMAKATLWISGGAAAFPYTVATTDSAPRRELLVTLMDLACAMENRNQNIGVKAMKGYCVFGLLNQC